MRKFIVACFGLFITYAVIAAPPVTEAPIKDFGTPVTVAISSTTLTKVPTSQASGRNGIYISNPSTSAVAGFLGNCTSTALASTIRPFQISLQDSSLGPAQMFFVPIREDVCMWLISVDVTASSKNVHYQEVIK